MLATMWIPHRLLVGMEPSPETKHAYSNEILLRHLVQEMKIYVHAKTCA